MGFVGVELFQLGVKSNPGLCICFFFLCFVIGQRNSRTKVSRILVTRVFPRFFGFFYLHSI